MTACGGGGSSKNSDNSQEPENTSRIVKFKYHLDANDNPDLEMLISYNDKGQPNNVRHIIIDDGEVDTTPLVTINDSLNLTIEADERNQITKYNFRNGRNFTGETVIEWNDFGITSTEFMAFSDTGELVQSENYRFNYSNSRLDTVSFVNNSPNINFRGGNTTTTFLYNDNNRVVQAVNVDDNSNDFFNIDFVYADNKVTGLRETELNSSDTYEQSVDITVNNGLIVSAKKVVVNVFNFEQYNGGNYSYNYDENKRLLSILQDYDFNGSADIRVELEWEEGKCVPLYTYFDTLYSLAPLGFIDNNTYSTSKANTQINYCETFGHY